VPQVAVLRDLCWQQTQVCEYADL